MKFACLFYHDENAMGAFPPSQRDAYSASCKAWVEGLQRDGQYVNAVGLASTQTATTVRVRNDQVSFTDGPFAETKELVAGYWIWEVKSMEEALEWVKKCPNPMPGEDSDIDIRPHYTMEDFK